MVATIIPNDIAGMVAEQLDSPIEEVVAIQHTTTRKMYNATWQTNDGPLPIVIRFYQGTRCEEAARVEATALRSLANSGYPVPALYLCADSSHVGGAPFIVMQRLPGRTLTETALEEPASIPYWIDQASALLMRLHSIPCYEGFDYFQPELGVLEFAERQVKWWSVQAQKAGAAATKAGFDWLRANVYLARECKQISLVHRDFHPSNLIADGLYITGVLDWGELTIADPAIDVAWSRMVLETEVNPQMGEAFCEAYQRRHPTIATTLPFWEVFAACKRLTTMAMLQRAAETTDDEIRLPKQETIEAVQAFMNERLVYDD
jgi:aminoglycoside phosphotransferase (APT) family kinase protein